MSDESQAQAGGPATSIETALAVEGISQEYAWVAAFTCVCGYWGNLEVQLQALIQGDEGRYYDRLDTKCTACGVERSFYFDVTKLFEGYAKLLQPPEGGPDGPEAGD